ncbi:hypothetical protein MMC10_006050 [Thelotrema lepadinum]|nr:hypothetical protein [Thelotrema lepadinum]
MATFRYPTWSWRGTSSSTSTDNNAVTVYQRLPGHFEPEDEQPTPTSNPQQSQSHTSSSSTGPKTTHSHSHSRHQPQSERYWPSRTCRICLESVSPTLHMPPDSLPSFLQPRKPRVTYVSDDPTLGRLIRPCKCKGSARYVHEGCLRGWRHSDAGYTARNYWSCPTCGFKYRLRRLGWGHMIGSTASQLVLTLAIFVVVVFVLGFVADPIINFYMDPYDTFASGVGNLSGEGRGEGLFPGDEEWEERGWGEHFGKGLAGLGLLGFLKALMAMSWWNWWNLRGALPGQGGGVRVGGGTTGRDRVAGVSFLVIAIGAGTFLWAVYKGVRAWSRRTLERASEKVMDVPLDDDEEEFVDDEKTDPQAEPGASASGTSS